MRVNCPTSRAPAISAPDVGEDGFIKYKHHELALQYNELADMNDAKAECIETFNKSVTDQSEL